MSKLNPPVSNADHRAGPDNAPVTMVEYGDFECPHCGAAHAIVQAVQAQLGDALRFVFRNFPLSEIHPNAERAAEAAEAAGVQGKFWEMHDLLFENQDALEASDLVAYATELELDVERFKRDLGSGTFRDRIRKDFQSGVKSGVNGTPTFFINGGRHDGQRDAKSLAIAIERAAGRSA